MKYLLPLATLAMPTLLSAQSVSVTLQAVTPGTLHSNLAGQVLTQVLPAGAMPAAGNVSSVLGDPTTFAGSILGWESSSNSLEATATIQWIAGVSSSSPSFANTTAVNVLMTITASSPVTVAIDVQRTKLIGAGASILLNRVDVGNDGLAEVQESDNSKLLGPYAVNTSLSIMVRLEATQAANGDLQLDNTIRVLPVNDLVVQGNDPFGCLGDELRLQPSFVGRGIGLMSLPNWGNDLAVAVLGTSIQPIALPPVASCLLLPSPDVLLVLPNALLVDLPLPAAVRPVGFWAQGVVLSSLGYFTTTNLFSVIAF